jgi:hypothetical protein
VALAARREVRDAARLAGCEVLVDVPADAPSRVDGAALELTLTTLLLAALARTSVGGRVRVTCAGRADVPAPPDGIVDETGDGPACAVLCVALEHGDGSAPQPGEGLGEASTPRPEAVSGGALCWDASGLELAMALAGDYGGRLGVDASVDSAHDQEELVAALARGPAVYLRLPVVEAGTALDVVAVRAHASVPEVVRGGAGREAAR